MSKTICEYIFLDGYKTPNLRSKTYLIDYYHTFTGNRIDELPQKSFDGSSTKQAKGNNSDCILKPVYKCNNPFTEKDSYLVFCEVLNPDGSPHKTNTRHLINENEYNSPVDSYNNSVDESEWFGFEQEYFLMENDKPIGFPEKGQPKEQGESYCGVGSHNVQGREIMEEHMNMCLKAGLDITGTNMEVCLGQCEYQLLSQGRKNSGDELWISRYILYRVSEQYDIEVSLHPKPVLPENGYKANGSGLHVNFSTEEMRNEGGLEIIKEACKKLGKKHKQHIKEYGEDNHLRLTGDFETQSIDKFSWGESDRGASIRIPLDTINNKKGYLEDRRPASNADPYKVIKCISDTIGTKIQEKESIED
ncbi:glutamine synthetase [Candidatus Wolfebacteria bacterium]|nr:MAG: glutamine synthetase [Candidatus Wolfebacteria bacterium]